MLLFRLQDWFSYSSWCISMGRPSIPPAMTMSYSLGCSWVVIVVWWSWSKFTSMRRRRSQDHEASDKLLSRSWYRLALYGTKVHGEGSCGGGPRPGPQTVLSELSFTQSSIILRAMQADTSHVFYNAVLANIAARPDTILEHARVAT